MLRSCVVNNSGQNRQVNHFKSRLIRRVYLVQVYDYVTLLQNFDI